MAKDDIKRPVAALDGSGEPCCIFESINQAARMLGLRPNGIWCCCNGKIKQTGGYKFAWV